MSGGVRFARGGDWLADGYEGVGMRGGYPQPDNSPARAMVREHAIREALGRWVSELEPTLVFNLNGHFMGLSGPTVLGEPVTVSVVIRGEVAI